ncbi:MAG: hypothetical protein JW993_19795 [Sedimentisphaerales bacterium]|nr:hypothetical protein [Sedimentisphaerales bacterium]
MNGNRVWVWIIVCLLVAQVCLGQGWQPAEGPLKTRWTDEVSPEKVWPEYPRPQMVRPDWMNLNGLWDYAIVARDAGRPETWDGKILVPFAVESALSGVMKPVGPANRLWYRRTFEVPESGRWSRDRRRILLNFGAVDWETTVWVNGTQVGSHQGGYDPFTFDITDALNESGSQEIVVSVWDPTDAGTQPRGKQVRQPGGIMYTAVTGIWQTVWLEPVGPVYIESLKLVPDVDNELVRLTVSLAGDIGDPNRYGISATFDKVRVSEEVSLPVFHAVANDGQVEIRVREPKLWSPESPYLYETSIEVHRATRPGGFQTVSSGSSVLPDYYRVDSVDTYFAMRKIEVKKDADGINRLFLNDKPLFQYGPLDQGWWPDGLYTPATDETIKYDIEMTKKFGMNMARKHVKYECARWYCWCDKLGLLVWQDMPSGDAGRNAESRANFRRELKGMIDALHNFPSIVMWVPFNEGWGQHNTEEIVQWIQQCDPSRPVNEASGWTDRGSGDISDIHSYPGPGMRPVEDDRVLVLGEFGGLGMPVKGHTWQDEANWGYVSFQDKEALTNAYVDLLTRMRPLIGQGLSAAVYTQTSDVEVEVNGLMTYDRELVKMDLERIAEAASKLYLPPPKVTIVIPTSQHEPQTWRYTTTEPANGWTAPDFDDSSWATGVGGFGTRGTPGTTIGTVWNTSDIWLRRTFMLHDIPSEGELGLMIHHDEDAQVYVNGVLVGSFSGYLTSYLSRPASEDAASAFKQGTNTMAIHCRQTSGGQYIDAGLALVQEQPQP